MVQEAVPAHQSVCADPHLTIDYCTSALTDLPVLGTGQVVGGGD